MNLLIDILPESVFIEGVEYEIDSNFRTFILFELLMLDELMDPEEKIIKTLELFYITKCPPNIEKAIDKMLWFYRCGKDDNQVARY